MVEEKEAALDALFHALADATRRDLLLSVAEREQSVGELAEPYHMSLAAVSKHLQVLERAGLVVKTREGRIQRCRFEIAPLADATELIAKYRQFWEGRFDALDRFLKQATRKEKQK